MSPTTESRTKYRSLKIQVPEDIYAWLAGMVRGDPRLRVRHAAQLLIALAHADREGVRAA